MSSVANTKNVFRCEKIEGKLDCYVPTHKYKIGDKVIITDCGESDRCVITKQYWVAIVCVLEKVAATNVERKKDDKRNIQKCVSFTSDMQFCIAEDGIAHPDEWPIVEFPPGLVVRKNIEDAGDTTTGFVTVTARELSFTIFNMLTEYQTKNPECRTETVVSMNSVRARVVDIEPYYHYEPEEDDGPNGLCAESCVHPEVNSPEEPAT